MGALRRRALGRSGGDRGQPRLRRAPALLVLDRHEERDAEALTRCRELRRRIAGQVSGVSKEVEEDGGALRDVLQHLVVGLHEGRQPVHQELVHVGDRPVGEATVAVTALELEHRTRGEVA
jgi:hypothetical protein